MTSTAGRQQPAPATIMDDPCAADEHERPTHASTDAWGAIQPEGRILGALSLLACAALVSPLLWPPAPLFVWNASDSSPVGLYVVTASAAPRAGDMAAAWAPLSARRIAAIRSYLPFDVPLVKRVAATEGDCVCAWRSRIFINGRAVAARQPADPKGRPLLFWSGCTELGRGDVFLLSSAGPLAFDGRYFGVTRHSDLIGKVHLLWPR